MQNVLTKDSELWSPNQVKWYPTESKLRGKEKGNRSLKRILL